MPPEEEGMTVEEIRAKLAAKSSSHGPQVRLDGQAIAPHLQRPPFSRCPGDIAALCASADD